MTESPLTSDDQAAIARLLEKLRDGWERGDGISFAAPFARDAEYITATGDHLAGREQIADLHQRVFDGIFKGTRLGGTRQSVKVVSPDVVLVQSEGGILFAGESAAAMQPNGIATTVIAKQQGAWQIVSFQNTPTGRHRKLRFLLRSCARSSDAGASPLPASAAT